MWYPIPELDGSSPEEVDARLKSAAGLVNGFLDQQLSEHGVPASRLALLGFSQGAGLAYEIAPRRPEQMAGIVAIAGRMKRKASLDAEVRSTPPFLILTGEQDRLLTSEERISTIATLEAVGIPVTTMMMKRTGHGISQDGMMAAVDFLQSVFSVS